MSIKFPSHEYVLLSKSSNTNFRTSSGPISLFEGGTNVVSIPTKSAVININCIVFRNLQVPSVNDVYDIVLYENSANNLTCYRMDNINLTSEIVVLPINFTYVNAEEDNILYLGIINKSTPSVVSRQVSFEIRYMA